MLAAEVLYTDGESGQFERKIEVWAVVWRTRLMISSWSARWVLQFLQP